MTTARPLAAPLQMAKHAQFKIIKKKMHKRPKKVSESVSQSVRPSGGLSDRSIEPPEIDRPTHT